MRFNNFKKQDGAVAIIVSVTIMAILSLIVISFSQLMRREERQALDRHLSSQAYYAAESAINDAAAALTRNEITANFNNCTGSPLDRPVLDATLDVEYSCVTLSSDPTSLEFDSVSTNQSVQTELHSRDSSGLPSNLQSLKITWQNPTGDNYFVNNASTVSVPQTWPAQQVGLLRFEIFRLVDVTGTYNRDALLRDRRIFWFYPNLGGAGTVDWTATNGAIVNGNCTNSPTGSCTVDLTGLPGGSYVVRIRSIYTDSKVSISGTNAAGIAHFIGAQVVVDATGRANDVLRRISARIAINQTYPIPEFAVQAFDGICKDIDVTLPGTVSYLDCQ
jgi:Tfp pilus assembly protein PilX